MTCSGCRFRNVKNVLNCNIKPLPKGMRFCTELAKTELAKTHPVAVKRMKERDKAIIGESWGPNDANFERKRHVKPKKNPLMSFFKNMLRSK